MGATDLVLRMIDALDALEVPYMLVGSYSSNFYGQPRMTKDADFVHHQAAMGEGRTSQERPC